jgi:subtilisin family serine protease
MRARAVQPIHAVALAAAILAGWAAPVAAERPVVPPEVAQQAARDGVARVIVHLGGTGAIPEGLLAGPAVAAQRRNIAAAQHSVRGVLARHAHRVMHQYATLPALAIEVGPDALAALEALSGLVVAVEEDRLAAPGLAESGPLVEADAAQAAGYDGTGSVVAVLDTGVDRTHPFLSGKVIEEACYSANGNCPNGQTSQVGTGAAAPCTYAASACRHGTHVAGIVAGAGAFQGVARNARIIAVQVFSRFTGSICGSGENPCALSYTSDQIAGLEYVYSRRNAYRIAAVNMSLGGGLYTAPCDSQSTACPPTAAPSTSASTPGSPATPGSARTTLTPPRPSCRARPR